MKNTQLLKVKSTVLPDAHYLELFQGHMEQVKVLKFINLWIAASIFGVDGKEILLFL